MKDDSRREGDAMEWFESLLLRLHVDCLQVLSMAQHRPLQRSGRNTNHNNAQVRPGFRELLYDAAE